VVVAAALTGTGAPACLAACAPLTDTRRVRAQSTVALDMTSPDWERRFRAPAQQSIALIAPPLARSAGRPEGLRYIRF
jgi:hypothetical protein